MAAGRAVVLAGAAGLAAVRGSREQPPHSSPAAASSAAARPARAARLVIAVLAGAGLAGQGVPGGRGGLRRVPGQAAGRAARCLAVRAAVGRGGAGRGELGEPQPRAGACRRAARPPRPGRRGWRRGRRSRPGRRGSARPRRRRGMPGGGGPASRACSAASRLGLRSQNRTGVVMPVRAARAAYPASLAMTRLSGSVPVSYSRKKSAAAGGWPGACSDQRPYPSGRAWLAPGGGAAPLAPPALQRLPGRRWRGRRRPAR